MQSKCVAALLLISLPGLLAQSPSASAAPPLSTPPGTFSWSQAYPAAGAIPTPKPEWLELISNASIPNAPLSKVGPDGALIIPPTDEHCSWTFSKCMGPKDIQDCTPGHWALTFDDGPTTATPALISYLEKANIKAAFFLLGGQVIQHPETVQQLYKAGHEIAIHTWSHNMLTTLTNEQIVAELKWTEEAIKEVIGVSPRFIRPPQGDVDNRVRAIAEHLGFINVLWNHDTFDYRLGLAQTTVAQIEQSVKQWAAEAKTASVGGISLQHDTNPLYVETGINTIIPTLQQAYTLTSVASCGQLDAVYKENVTSSDSKKNDESAAVPVLASWATIAAAFVSLAMLNLV